MRKIILLLLFCATSLYAQNPLTYQSSATGNITATGSTCATTNACISVHLPPGSTSVAVTITGTWSATLVVEMAADNGVTWVSAGTGPSANGQTTYTLTAQTDFRVRASAFTSGTVGVFINVAPPTIVNLGPVTVTGAANGVGTGAAPKTSIYFGPDCNAGDSRCFFTFADTQQANDASWTAGIPTVNSATAHFCNGTTVPCASGQTSDVGKRIAGYATCAAFTSTIATQASSTPLGIVSGGPLTITAVVSSTQVTLNGNAQITATGNSHCVFWGHPDDANAVIADAAIQALGTCARLTFSGVNYWFGDPHFYINPPACVALGSIFGNSGIGSFANIYYAAGLEWEGRGRGVTNVFLPYTFPETSPCTNGSGNACFVRQIEGRIADITFTGGGDSTSNMGNGKQLFELRGPGSTDNFLCTNFDASNINNYGFFINGWESLRQFDNSGCGYNGINIASGAQVTAIQLAVENNPVNLNVSGPGTGTSDSLMCYECHLLGAQWTGSGNNITILSNGATLTFTHLLTGNSIAGGTIYKNQASGGILRLFVNSALNIGTTTTNGIVLTAAGKVYVENSTVNGGASAFAYTDVAGSNLFDQGANTFTGPLNILGTNHHSETGTCTFAAATTCVVTFARSFGVSTAIPSFTIPPNIPATATTLTVSALSATGATITASASNSAAVQWAATLQ